MRSGPPARSGSDPASGYKARLGTRMFLLYAAVYAGFVTINSVDPRLMGAAVLGENLAIVYGFALIVLALVLALIYNALCSREEQRIAGAAVDQPEEVDG